MVHEFSINFSSPLLTSSWLTFMYSQIRLRTSDCSISLPAMPKKLASASDIITEGEGSALFVPDSTSTFCLFGTGCSESAKT